MNQPTAFHRFYYRRVAQWPEGARQEARTRIREASIDVQCCVRDREVWPIVQDLEAILCRLETQFPVS